MARYTYRCEDHGVFHAVVPMARSADPQPCPECGATARKVIEAPSLNLGDGRARRLIDRTERSAGEPEVVTSLPSRSGPVRQVRNPATLRLPRS